MTIPQGLVSCYAMSAGKITDAYFNVRVPALGLSTSVNAGGSTASEVITAKNCTDYRTTHKGIISMEATDYHVTPSVEKADGPVPSHGHAGVEPFKGTGVVYSNLNDVEVSVGDLLIGAFLDGDSKNLVIIHIPHKVPIGGDVKFD